MRYMVLLVSLHLGILESPFNWQSPPCHDKLAYLPLLCGINPAICKPTQRTVEQWLFCTAAMVVDSRSG